MTIEILKSCSGYNFSFKQGDIVAPEDFVARDLVKCGFAKKIDENAAATSGAAESSAKKKTAARKKAVSDDVKS